MIAAQFVMLEEVSEPLRLPMQRGGERHLPLMEAVALHWVELVASERPPHLPWQAVPQVDSVNPRPSPDLAEVGANETPHHSLRAAGLHHPMVATLLAAAPLESLTPSLGMEQETPSVGADLRCLCHVMIRGSLGRWAVVVWRLP